MIFCLTAAATSAWTTVFAIAEAVGGACVAIHYLTEDR